MKSDQVHPVIQNPTGWKPTHVLVMAAVCLAAGLAIGYLLPSQAPARVATTGAMAANPVAANGMPSGHPNISLEQMKQLAQAKATPLLAQLKKDPKNAAVLAQVGGVYQSAHQFDDAADYYRKSLDINAKDVSVRTSLAACLFYSGDVDGAVSQLEKARTYDPKDVNALFNLGYIRWKGKKDAPGAIADWQELLKLHPNLDRKAEVEQLIAEAKAPAEPVKQSDTKE